jgi:hypothetical protein
MVIITIQLMMYKAKLADYSDICTKHSMHSEHHVECLDVKPGGTVRRETARLNKVNAAYRKQIWQNVKYLDGLAGGTHSLLNGFKQSN